MEENMEYVVISAEPELNGICTLCKPDIMVCDVCERKNRALSLVPLTDSVIFHSPQSGLTMNPSLALLSTNPQMDASPEQRIENTDEQIKNATRVYCIPAMDNRWSGVTCSRVRTNLKRLIKKRNRLLPVEQRRTTRLDSIKKTDAVKILRQIHISLFKKYFYPNSPVMSRHARVYFNGISENSKFYQNVELKEIPISKIKPEQIERFSMCTVCLVSFERGDYVRELGCHHVYHWECISRWEVEQRTCPCCRIYMNVRSVVNYGRVKFTPASEEVAKNVVDAACYAAIMLSFPSTSLVSRIISPIDVEVRRSWFIARSRAIVRLSAALRAVRLENIALHEAQLRSEVVETDRPSSQNLIEAETLINILSQSDIRYIADGFSL